MRFLPSRLPSTGKFGWAALAILLAVLTGIHFIGQRARANDEMTSTILVGNSRIDVAVEKGDLQASKEDLMKWVRWAAESVSGYYGRLPVPHLLFRIIPTDGRGVRGGRTFDRGDGGFISIHVGSQTDFAYLANDWMLTHEMTHLSFPSMADNHHWIEEGIATYVEPIARVRAKHMDANEMWFEVVRDMHQGLPATGDEGLDHTHTWGRTYWGGALFCLLADVEIHQRTANKHGLQDALRAILNTGGSIEVDWPLERALQAGDAAVGVPVLTELYDRMKAAPVDTDLPALWRQLGVKAKGDAVTFDDGAPMAAIRRAITMKPR